MTATGTIKVRIDGDRRRPIPPPGCHIDPAAYVHPSCKLAPNVWIGPGVQIGADCVIGPGAVIGGPGFGYEWSLDGWNKKPESHGVVVEDDVHIGANTCIDRGSYRDTIIGTGTRIDNLVHVAHNVWIAAHCMVIAGAELSGSVMLGERVWVGPNACVREHLNICDGAMVGIGAVVVKDVPAGETWVGNPARRLK